MGVRCATMGGLKMHSEVLKKVAGAKSGGEAQDYRHETLPDDQYSYPDSGAKGTNGAFDWDT